MIDENKIKSFLEGEGFEEVDEIEYEDNIKVFNFFYAFDEAETDAAKDYANNNYNEKNGEKEWYDKYFLPNLLEIASDNVKDILEDTCEKFKVSGEYIMYEIDKDYYEQVEVTIIIGEEGAEFDIEKILDELDL